MIQSLCDDQYSHNNIIAMSKIVLPSESLLYCSGFNKREGNFCEESQVSSAEPY